MANRDDRSSKSTPKGKGDPGAKSGPTPPAPPTVVDPSPALRELRQSLDDGARELKAALTTAVSEAVRGQLEHQLLGRVDQALQVRFDRASTELAARDRRVSDALAQAQETVGQATARLSTVSEEVLAERIHGAVEAATRSVADEIFRREFARRVTELEGLFEDVDDQFGKVRAYVEQFGPGGLPVLAQRVEAEAAQRAQAMQRLAEAEDEIRRLKAVNDSLESERRRWKVAATTDPQVLDRKLADLAEQSGDLAERAALEGQNQRLSHDLEKLREELRQWRDRDLEVQRADATQRSLDRALLERQEADEARARSEYELGRVRSQNRRLQAELERLQAALHESAAQQAAAEDRERRLELLTEQVAESRRLHEDARGLVAKHEASVDRLLSDVQRLQGELLIATEAARRARDDARDSLVAEQAEQRAAERARLGEWADRDAALRASEHVARADALEERRVELVAEVARLQDALDASRSDTSQAQALARSLEQQLAALEESVQERKRVLDEEATDRRARLERELVEERQRVQAEARADGEREAEAARKDADEQSALADQFAALVQERENELHRLSGEIAKLSGERGQLEQILADLQSRVSELRLKAVPEEERLADLRRPVFAGDDLLAVETQSPSETEWLEQVQNRIRGAGFTFHPRLVRAFHTSLKIADQAPLTVLAGISGTGKSELPRLYADLGGLPFLELAVQPRWDSPDDLFGFFNYTDGRLKAEPLARLLHQVNTREDPLRQGPCLVLLDEMNIARVEYYFSDLLSKLEARRTVKRTDTEDARKRASIRLSTGSGQGEVSLYPDERVLFVGTMNEDESTLTLSDKVLDRASVLTFPAPRAMSLRDQGRASRRHHRLSWETWSSWRDRTAPADVAEELNQVNDLMERVGRPFGHRLFRAIHAYIACYPAAGEQPRRDAWSDQFAMKILPRLRGLECGDRQVALALDSIHAHVPEELQDSFDQARDREFFAWSGARDLYQVEGGA